MKPKRNEVRRLSKLITFIEEHPKETDKILRDLKKGDEKAKVVGFTGNPGSGKSTLISAVADYLRRRDMKIAILAVDPKSPLSGGTFFGDRIRMVKHYLDESVFIRSISGDGSGGISPVLYNIIRLVETFGFDYIFVESVGTGQSEIDISFFVDVLVLVLSPGGGDDIQFLKAGLMEVADIYAINKSDLEEFIKFFNLLKAQPIFDDKKTLVKVSALTGEGINELCKVIDEHWDEQVKTNKLPEKRKKAILKQAQMLMIKELEIIISTSGDNLEFENVQEAMEFLKRKLIENLEG